jgi:hypothetical protein
MAFLAQSKEHLAKDGLDKSSFPLLTPAGRGPMSDIFISYSRQDSHFAESLIIALVNYGWSVWTDKSAISEGRPYDEQTEHAIGEATVTLVVWSQASVKSRWVRAEAAYALDRNKLVPLIVEDVDPPLQFLHIHAINLVGWIKPATICASKNSRWRCRAAWIA